MLFRSSGFGGIETFLGENLNLPSLVEAGKANREAAAAKYEEPYQGETAAAFQRGILPGIGTAISNVTGPVGQAVGAFGPGALAATIAAPFLPEELMGIALSQGARKVAVEAAAFGMMEAGENIEHYKDLHPNEKVNLITQDLTGAVQGAIDAMFAPAFGKLSNK